MARTGETIPFLYLKPGFLNPSRPRQSLTTSQADRSNLLGSAFLGAPEGARRDARGGTPRWPAPP